MSIYDIIFYLFAILTLGSGYLVVTSKNIVHAAFYLLFTFFGVAGIYVLLGADFLAIVQLMVYVGGILILLLFGVMLTNRITDVKIRTGTVHIIPAVVGTGLFMGVIVSMMLRTNWKSEPAELPISTMYGLGRILLVDYVLVFELLAILLLIALIGAASIARRDTE
ncbi:MAG: NADH-quinone oxidoreductase subunit J [Melioribacteraceae bacterium]|jgi:NADH-quinone oxidoreductase subunit J|nr:MAG: NADH-quinone oxidoreductase subunit J [Ignavibacteriales bacterium]WKZ70755.1 MAG: NADH-quinone oxidoreductase subunit J [Melioribacteraceae bacterium]